MNDEKLNLEHFVSKIDYEGGLDSALSYGLTTSSYDLPKEVQDKWAELQEVHADFEVEASEFWKLCEQYGVDY